MLEPKKNEELIKDLLKRTEGQDFDFKLHVNDPQKLAKTLTAFANTNGGTLVIGVSDNKRLIGVDVEEEKYMVEKSINEFCIPPVDVEYQNFETESVKDSEAKKELNILIVRVKKSDKIHFQKNNKGVLTLYKRVFDRTLPVKSN
ncbi:Predicted transcriptional regulator containing an HTH domain and an uncharacterized domain shared with the mammalian protein Schlafen [Aquiflexum balticum DSM 16537]|uniref:Predicted transcriptional regulator containing an HTH domain and an uncharacterized domain shared with the mammalian protein Schlafen n=1 Tax=Aquiflexum balticum DSM 16537 TaxID=758820 RepID=A0A1W2H8I6_9BACT|nr:ATP-binding protein [Aquiflexum balticum]SMD45190.1 Predicted transcriptional regulator containing an HTH domain and an uncharacterized domain shared with the mammalian protein Schlafen [Aquiflexum balticum DSM 16537]